MPARRGLRHLCGALALCAAGFLGGCDDAKEDTPADLTVASQPDDQGVVDGDTATFSVTATGAGTVTYQWQQSSDGGATWQDISGATDSSYTTPIATPSEDGVLFRCVISDEGGSVTSRPAAIVMTPPTVVAQPADLTVVEGDSATFTVNATGSGTITYQWQREGIDVAGGTGGTTACYTLPAPTLSDTGAQFTCVVTNAAGSVTSDAATLMVDMAPPAITAHPSSQTVTEGQTATFTVEATDPGTMTYQWKKDGVNVTGGTGGSTVSYTTPPTILADSGAQFTCVVANAGNSAESDPAALTVSMAVPTIGVHPVDQTVLEGQTATFAVTATGSGTLSYQWKQDGVDVAGGTGGTLASYTTPTTVLGDSSSVFTCDVTNAAGTVESNAATLTVNMAPPTITTHPSNQTVVEGETATFTVAATGSATLTYQWRQGGVDVSTGTGGTTANYTTPVTALVDSGTQFTCVVTNAVDSIESDAATLTVKITPPAITDHPSDQTVLEGQTATFTVAATDPGTMTYQWKKDGVNVAGGTGDTTAGYTTPSTVLADSGAQFTCVVANAGNSAESDPATLAVNIDPANTYMIVDLSSGSVTYAATIADLETNDVYKTTSLVLKVVNPGSFQMGEGFYPESVPLHAVSITRAFYLGVFEVTQKQWQMVEGTWPSRYTSAPDKRPVECVTWNAIKGSGGFMDSLSFLTAMGFRLPTEAEWEYSCRAGTSTEYSFGVNPYVDWLWYIFNSGDQTHEVATTISKPNPWGFYDMHGNVYEWCEDWYDATYYQYCVDNSIIDDPQGPADATARVLRGGSFATGDADAFSGYRHKEVPTLTWDYIGFRVVLAPGPWQ